MAHKGHSGASMGGMESSPARRKRMAARRRREEARWAARSGPVTVRRVDPAPPDGKDSPDPAA